MEIIKTGRIAAEIKRNLLGALEVALFMPIARTRFGDSREEALRSFIVPVLLFPLFMTALYFSSGAPIADKSATLISLLYSLRMLAVWAFFFGAVYWIAAEIDRKKHFYQFVIASNWLSVPATVVFIPVGWMLMAGTHSWAELYPFMNCLMFYTYAFTAFMASYVLRVPWELAGFIVFLGMCIDNSTLDLIYWFGDKL